MTAPTEVLREIDERRLADVLDDLLAFCQRFVLFANLHQVVAVVLFTAHTYLFAEDEAMPDSTPYLMVTAPEKRSGKSRLLEVLELICRAAHYVADTSVAALFRLIDRDRPTLLFDEADAVFGSKRANRGSDKAEELRAIFNAGHRRGAVVQRVETVGRRHELRDFAVFCPKAIASIGDLPDTIGDRSIPIRLQRKAPGEVVERFRRRRLEAEAELLRQRMKNALEPLRYDLPRAEPDLPDALHDRAQDGWEPLLAIADAAGAEWAKRAREAAVFLHGGGSVDTESVGVRLLTDIREVVGDREQIRTADLLAGLHDIEDGPWAEWYGKPLNAHKLGRMLAPYGIGPRDLKVDSQTVRGYDRQRFDAAWVRYLPPQSMTVRPMALSREKPPIPKYDPEGDGRTSQSPGIGFKSGKAVESHFESANPAPEQEPTGRREPYPDPPGTPTKPGVWASARRRCGADVDRFTADSWPYCEACGAPELSPEGGSKGL
jgi:hypothetical protein